MSDNPNVSQSDLQQAFESYHQMILPYLGGGSTNTGFTPVGTVIAYYGETAPAHYLICDGSEYNKTDYPDLWTHLSSLTDTTPYIVDGNNTKFKVPDLRGEFLRGSGTNGHTNQFTGMLEGSGSNVGQHQDATVLTDVKYIKTNEELHYYNTAKYNTTFPANPDSVVKSTYSTGTPNATYTPFGSSKTVTDMDTLPTTRPTNTSVLFCIAYHDIQIYNIEQLHKYSTEEQVVGTWIDGKPVYEKTLSGTLTNLTQEYRIPHGISNLLNVVGLFAICRGGSDSFQRPIAFTYYDSSAWDASIAVGSTDILLQTGRDFTSQYNSREYVITIRYTKTTDTPSV